MTSGKAICLCHLKWRRKGSARPPVRQPRHLIAFYIDDSRAIIVARAFHQRQMPGRHLRDNDDRWVFLTGGPKAERSISRGLRTVIDPDRTSSKLKRRREVVLQIDRFSRSNGLVGGRKVSIVRLPATYGMKRAESTGFPVEQKPGSKRGESIHGGYEADRLVDGDRIEVNERGIRGVLHAHGKYDVHAGTGVVLAPA